jgi:hypothetical protein
VLYGIKWSNLENALITGTPSLNALRKYAAVLGKRLEVRYAALPLRRSCVRSVFLNIVFLIEVVRGKSDHQPSRECWQFAIVPIVLTGFSIVEQILFVPE